MECLPEYFFKAKNITYLRLPDVRLRCIPDRINRFVDLEILDFTSSQVTHLPRSIAQLTKLREVHVNKDIWDSLEVHRIFLSHSYTLTEKKVYWNRNIYYYGRKLDFNAHKIDILYDEVREDLACLDANDICSGGKGIPKKWDGFINLKRLSVSNNGFTERVFPHEFEVLSKLTHLKISNNKILIYFKIIKIFYTTINKI